MPKKKEEQEQLEKTGNISKFLVTTDVMPVWDDKRHKKNAIIEGPEDNEAIKAMLKRGWIKKV